MRLHVAMLITPGIVLGLACCRGEAGTGAAPPATKTATDQPPAAKSPVPPKGARLDATEPAASGYAVVEPGAFLFSTPGDSPRGYRVSAPSSVPAGLVVSVHGTEGSRVEVGLSGLAVSGACASRPTGLADFSVKMYVERADLVPVSIKPVEHAFSDGTKVSLRPGVPLRGSDPAARKAVVGPTTFELPIDAARVGEFYEPDGAFETDHPAGALAPGSAPLTYDRGTELSPAGFGRGDAGDLVHFGSREDGDEVVVTLRHPCAQVVARTVPARIGGDAPAAAKPEPPAQTGKPAKFRQMTPPSPDQIGAPAHHVAKGAKVYLRDGTEAGTVLAAHTFAELPRPSRGRPCFDIPMMHGDEDGSHFAVCFDEADLEPVDREIVTMALRQTATSAAESEAVTAAVGGSRNRGTIRHVVQAHLDPLRHCYASALPGHPAQEGKVVLRTTIATDGTVQKVEATTDTLGTPAIAKCMTEAATAWRFELPEPVADAIAISYAFTFAVRD